MLAIEELIAFGVWELTEILAVIVFFSNLLTIFLPNNSRYRPVQWVLDVLNKLSMNIYQNANRWHDAIERAHVGGKYDIDEAVDRAIKKREQEEAKRKDKRVAGAKP